MAKAALAQAQAAQLEAETADRATYGPAKRKAEIEGCTHPRVPKFDCDAVRYSDASGSGSAAGKCILYYRCLATMTRTDSTSGSTGYTLWSRRVYGISNGDPIGLATPLPTCSSGGGLRRFFGGEKTFATIEEARVGTNSANEYIIEDFKKIFTNDAIIIPIKPIIKKDPNFVKSLLVV